MKTRIAALLVAMVFITGMLCGCQSEGGGVRQNVKIYLSLLESSEYYVNIAEAAQKKAAAEGVQLDVEYAENSIEMQDEQIKKAVAEKYDAIICSLVSPDTAAEIKGIAGEVPVVFINSAPDEKILVGDKYIYVASNEEIAGQYQAEYVLENFADKEELNVVILKGPEGHSATNGRTRGVKKVFKTSGKKINYVFEDYADFIAATAQELMDMFLKTGVSMDCVIGNNDEMVLGAIEACKQAGIATDSIMFLGIDASVDGCEAIKNGTMTFSVYQSTEGQSEMAVEAAVKLANGKSIQDIDGATADGKYIWIPYEKVDISNVEQYIAQ